MSEDTESLNFVDIEKSVRKKPGRPLGSLNKNHLRKKKAKEQEKARKVLWKKGVLHWKLDSNQKELRDMYYNHGDWTTIQWLCARQLGKSYLVTTIINEEANSKPGIIMAYVAPKLNQAKRIVNMKMREILADCPVELRPKLNSQDNKWTWPNGSELYMTGTDGGHAESIRGMTLNRVFVDEYCFLSDFEYVMNSIIFPTMMSVPDPLMVLISSPPKTPDHESNKWLDEAEEEGRLVIKTIYDCPRHTPEKIKRIIKEQYHGDSKSVGFRREMLCERIADTSRLVLPEMTNEKAKLLVREVERPAYYTINEAFDWGAADKNGGVFSYANYDEKIIVIEDEAWLSDIEYTTKDIADEIKNIEAVLWGGATQLNRFGDNNNKQLLIDMAVLYDLNILATRKDGLIASVNHVRNLLKHNQIIIHPKCVNLISQMMSCTWSNAEKKKFSKKTEKDDNQNAVQHHYDLVAALIYLVRNSNMEVSPYPIDFDLVGKSKETHFISPKRTRGLSEDEKILSEIFTVKRRRRR